jgi:hypothetical protein
VAKQEKGRPPYFLFDSAAWNTSGSIRNMDADQCGWYIQLLSDAWESRKTPQATLPNDDSVLKSAARYDKSIRELNKLFDDIQNQLTMPLSFMNRQPTVEEFKSLIGITIASLRQSHLEAVEQRWQAVRSMFKTDPSTPSLVYNPRQIKELKRWVQGMQAKIDAGTKGAERRWGTIESTTSKDLMSTDFAEPHPLLNGGAIADPSLEMGVPYIINNYKDQKSVSKDDTPKKLRIGEQSTVQELKPSLLRKKPETMFDEAKFVINEGMSAHLSQKYPEFVLGDWNWLVEKFKNVYHGKKYTSWSRTFYNFVANQVALYGYTAGAYAGRGAQPNVNQSNSAASRNQQLERDADEYTRLLLLQGSSVSNNQDDSEALPLTADDVRDS